MTIRQDLRRAGKILATNNIEDSSLESELFLRHTLKIDRVQLYLQFDSRLSPDQSERFWQLVQRRLNGEPTAYIVGHREFYGLDFDVDSSVLIPRPETELLVEKALELARQHSIKTIADIGTGCGAIAVSLAVKLQKVKIYATDISVAALKVAAVNCEKHGVADRICLLEGDLLDALPEPVDLIVANLPYVREVELGGVNTFGFEPELALSGGADGLDQIHRLCDQLTPSTLRQSSGQASSGRAGKLRPNGSVLIEIGLDQRQAVTALLRGLFPSAKIETFTDLAGIGRVVGLSY